MDVYCKNPMEYLINLGYKTQSSECYLAVHIVTAKIYRATIE